MLKKLEKDVNNRIVDFIIGGSYLGDYRTNIFGKLKKMGREAHFHILELIKKLQKWYKD